NVLGLEVEHALRRLRRKLLDRAFDHVSAQMFRYWHDVVAVDHQRAPGFLPVAFSLFQHVDKPLPRLGGRVLTAELAFAVAPTGHGNDRGNALVDRAGVNGDGGAKAAAHDRDALAIDLRLRGKKGQRMTRVLYLVETDDPAFFTLAVAAA